MKTDITKCYGFMELGNTFAERDCGTCEFQYTCSADTNAMLNRKRKAQDNVNHPAHYTSHPSGIECIQITEHMGFNLGNALKYIWRCDLKKDAIEDLEKARWYIEREIKKRRGE